MGHQKQDHTKDTGAHIHASSLHKYCWVRIPKCGGSSLFSFLKNNYKWDYRRYSGRDTGWEDYFKFAFARNPWDRLVSTFANKVIGKSPQCSQYLHDFSNTDITFTEWLEEITKPENIIKDRHFAPIETLMINKSFEAMDFIGKMETYQKDFNIVCEKLGIKKITLPLENASKFKRDHYSKYYTDKGRKIVADKYEREINFFDYKFEKR